MRTVSINKHLKLRIMRRRAVEGLTVRDSDTSPLMCVYAHTHTHCTDGVLACEPRSRDETPGGPEESRWTKSRHTYIRICVQSTHVYVYAKRRDEILD